MADAKNLIEKIKKDLKPVDEKILNHPYIKALASGKLPKDVLKTFTGQQYHIISSDLRSVSNMLARHGAFPSRAWLLGVLQGESAALDALFVLAKKLGMSKADLNAFEPLPAGYAYCAYVAWLGMYGSDGELAGAFLVNFAAWGTNCGKMAQALQNHYGFAGKEAAFFELFSNMPPLKEEVLKVMQAALDRGLDPDLVHRAARMLQAYELMFWDAMAEVSGIST